LPQIIPAASVQTSSRSLPSNHPHSYQARTTAAEEQAYAMNPQAFQPPVIAPQQAPPPPTSAPTTTKKKNSQVSSSSTQDDRQRTPPNEGLTTAVTPQTVPTNAINNERLQLSTHQVSSHQIAALATEVEFRVIEAAVTEPSSRSQSVRNGRKKRPRDQQAVDTPTTNGGTSTDLGQNKIGRRDTTTAGLPVPSSVPMDILDTRPNQSLPPSSFQEETAPPSPPTALTSMVGSLTNIASVGPPASSKCKSSNYTFLLFFVILVYIQYR
jgi:hypothetical protein